MKLRSTAWGLFAALAACGGGLSTGATLTGTVRGQALKPADAVSSPTTVQISIGTASVAAIVLSSAPALCKDVAARQEPHSSQYFVILLGDVNQGSFAVTAPTQPGDFTVFAGSTATLPPAHVAVVEYQQTDAACATVTGTTADGVSGNVHLTSVSKGAYQGTFDVTLQHKEGGAAVGDADHVTGSFNTALCDGLGALVSTTRTTTCL